VNASTRFTDGGVFAWARESAPPRRSCTPAARSASRAVLVQVRARGLRPGPSIAARLASSAGCSTRRTSGPSCAPRRPTPSSGSTPFLFMRSPCPHKEATEDPGHRDRFELMPVGGARRRALRGSASRDRARRPSYTVDTLAALRERHPEDELISSPGATWPRACRPGIEPERVLELASLRSAERRGAVREDVIERWRAWRRGPREPAVPRHAAGGRVSSGRSVAGARGPNRSLPRPRAVAATSRREACTDRRGVTVTGADWLTRSRASPKRRRRHIVELDLRGALGYTDYFVILPGQTRSARPSHSTTASTSG